ncbi:hypothetical protein Cni_G03418 [Canna indica]|uniref:Pentatricopeptide repeat-containing protein n=1 Tax=Canna indica TaxID=4628 RepID=A0AAQ3JR46_9LILI|nr:hypothetical protein Cni_G03418 [Canna indica]
MYYPRTANNATNSATLPPLMIPRPLHDHFCCRAFYNNSSRAWAAAAVPPAKRRPSPSKLPPRVRELSQLLLLRRPGRPPPTSNDSHLLLNKPPPLRNFVDSSSINAHENDEEESSGSGREDENSSCTPTDVLELMDALQIYVEEDLYLSLVKECTAYRDTAQGANVYAHIRRSCPGLLRQPAGLLLANRLLLMFAACGQIAFARQLFDQMPLRDATSWAIVVAALFAEGCHGDALRLFVEMCTRTDGGSLVLKPVVCWVNTLVTGLRSCTVAREIALGRQIHGMALKVLGGTNAVLFEDLCDALIQFYSQIRHHQTAVEVLNRTCSPSAAAWTSVITGYSREGQFKQAIRLFREMGRTGARRNTYVFSSTLAACAKVGDGGWSGKQVHTIAIKLGASSDKFVCSSLVDMYMKHELLIDGQRAFESANGTQDFVCWNALLIGYAQRGCGKEAVKLLYEMKAAGMQPQESVIHGVMMMAFDGGDVRIAQLGAAIK